MPAFRIGFRGFRRPETVNPEAVRYVGEATEGLFVYYLGGTYGRRRASLRSNALATVTEVKKPVPVSEVVRRASNLGDGLGYDPKTVLSGIKLHQGAKPAVYILVEKDVEGNLVAYKDVPFPGEGRPLRAGAVVVPAKEKAPKAPKKEKALPAPEARAEG